MESNLLMQADCLDAVDYLRERGIGDIQMIYIDPPFFSGTNYTVKSKGIGSAASAPEMSEKYAYKDQWEGGLNEYLTFMRERLEAIIDILGENGSLWVHLDWHVSHYVKVMLDEILGYDAFINEIIWKRTNSPKKQSRTLGSQHDVILVYSKSPKKFEMKTVYRPHDKRALKPYIYEDEKGRFRLIEIEAQGIQRTEGRKQYEWRGRTAPYLYRKETLDKWWEQGRIYKSRNGRYSKKQYLKEVPGIPVSDLWLDIPPVQGSSKEYSGFITQKPEKLLSRIIEASTNEGDLIADFFLGSGTTVVSAARMNRGWIGCDISSTSIEITEQRLVALKKDEPENISTGYELKRL